MAMRLLVFLLVLAITPAFGTPRAVSSMQPKSFPEGTLRLAYYYPPDPSSLESLRTNANRLDIVAPHWWTIDGEGAIARDERPQGSAYLRSSSLIVLPSVMVSSRAAGHAILSDPMLSRVAIQNLVAAVGPWDGLALDFEGLDPADRADLTRFIWDLGAALRDAGKLYLIALPAKSIDARTGWGGAYDFPSIVGAADLYLVMAYGWTTSGSTTPGSTSPLWWVEETMRYAAGIFPPSQLLLGIAYYGYDWNLSQGPPARALRYIDAAQLRDLVGATPALDARSATVKFNYVDAEGDRHEVWYEDHRAIAAKLSLVSALGLRGVGAWRLGQEDPESWRSWENLRPGTLAGAAPSVMTLSPAPQPVASEVTRPETATSGWLPTMWAGGAAELGLSVSNPSPTSAKLRLTLFNDDGSRVQMERELPGGGQLQLDLGGSAGGDAGLGFVASAPVTLRLRTTRSDGAATTVQPMRPSERWYFADGQSNLGIETSFALLNPGGSPARATVRARTAPGESHWEQTVSLPPEGRIRLVVPQGTSLEFFWTEITADAPIVAARQTRFAGAAQASTGLERDATRWSVENASLGSAWQNFLALANPGTATAQVQVKWTGATGDVVEQRADVVARGRAVVEPPGVAAQQTARAEITSSAPIVVERAAYERDGVRVASEPGTPQ